MADNQSSSGGANAAGGGNDGSGPPVRQRLSAETYGALDTTSVNDELWLIRIPTTLAQVWDKVKEGQVLGELVFKKGGNGVKPNLSIHVAPSVLEAQEEEEEEEEEDEDGDNANGGNATPHAPPVVPLSYSMQAMSKDIPKYYPFNRNPVTGSIRIWGTVSRTANLQVEKDDENYRKQLKDRLLATSVNSNRFVKPVDSIPMQSVVSQQQQNRRKQLSNLNASSLPDDDADSDVKPTFSNAVLAYGKRKNEMNEENNLLRQQQLLEGVDDGGPDDKRQRRFAADQPMRSVIFELFSKQKYWAVKDLKTAVAAGRATVTKKLEPEIREVLREIGEYHRAGDHKTMWELKKEYQQQH